jgi:hypothetical protein
VDLQEFRRCPVEIEVPPPYYANSTNQSEISESPYSSASIRTNAALLGRAAKQLGIGLLLAQLSKT